MLEGPGSHFAKLGAQPGVHGSEDVEKEAIKIDPKVFTVLQPTVIPMPAPPQARPAPSPVFQAMRACFHCMLFASCLLLVTLLGLYLIAATPDIFKKADITTATAADKPQMEALIAAQPIEGSSEKVASSASAENGGIMAIPLARVVVVEDISNNEGPKKTVVDGSVEEKSNGIMDRPLHPDEIEQFRMMEARQQFQQMIEERMYMQQMMAMRMMRLRRLQAAYNQQQQMKMAFMQQQQMQMQMQEDAARQQWAERARYEEDQRRQWEAQQAFAQQQQRAHAFWQQHQMEMQAQQAQAQWQQQQEQEQPRFWPRPMVQQPPQWQRPTVWQQPPQQFFFPTQQNQQQQQQQQQPEDRFPQAPQIFQPIPQPSVHDKIYEELQKKSQNIPVHAPSRQIWTAITPTPVPEETSESGSTVAPVPVNTAIPAVVGSSTPMPEDAADVSDTILRDIFSAFDEQKNSEAANKELNPATPSTTEQPEIEGRGAIVIEDSFPRIEERTTTPEPVESDEEVEHSSVEEKDHEKELDPFAAVLKFFENNPPRAAMEAAGEVTTEKPEKPIIV